MAISKVLTLAMPVKGSSFITRIRLSISLGSGTSTERPPFSGIPITFMVNP